MSGCGLNNNGVTELDVPPVINLIPITESDGEKPDVTLDEILSRVNNEIPADELIKSVYSFDDMIHVYGPHRDILSIAKDYKIECIRKVSEEWYYIILRSDVGDCVVLFENEDGTLKLSDRWYIFGRLLKRDFENLVIYESIFSDICALDKRFRTEIFLRTGMVGPGRTTHYTTDGYSVEILYGFYPPHQPHVSRHVVLEVNIQESGEDSIYQKLLPIDRDFN